MEENSLLEPIRKVKAAFLQSDNLENVLEKGTKVIAEITDTAVFVLEHNGKLLASYEGDIKLDAHMLHLAEEQTVAGDRGLEEMLNTDQSLFNIPYPAGAQELNGEQTAVAEKTILYTVIPIKLSTNPLGALLVYHPDKQLDDKALVMAEITSALVGLILLQDSAGQEEEDIRNKELAAGAFDSLSYSEVEAIREILKSIDSDNNESIVVASKIADSLGITRSVIVNALRKFESAGIIESRSLGMKGTLIRVKNVHALELVADRSQSMDTLR